MDAAADIVAGYAAVVATASLGWQIISARHARQPGIKVSMSLALLPFPTETVGAVCIRAANRGDKPVGVTGAGLQLQDGSGRTLVKFQMESIDTIPGTIEPHHAGELYLRQDFIEQNGIVLTQDLVAFANLATGDKVISKPTRLLSPS